MIKIQTLTVIITSLIFMSLVCGSTISPNLTYAEDQKFKANLSGDNEVPPVTSAADGKVKIKVEDGAMRSEINVTGISDITGAHIYAGKKSENGAPIVDLVKSGNKSETEGRIIIQGQIVPSDFEGSMSGKTLTDLQATLAAGSTYINILTADHPEGELRGQIKISGGNASKTESMNSNVTDAD